MSNRTVLVINSGSSSIKYKLINPDTTEVLASGLVDRIGEEISALEHKVNGEKHELQVHAKDHGEGLQHVLDAFSTYGPNLQESNVVAVGHRVVQGGWIFDKPAVIDDKVIDQVVELAQLAPLHNYAAAEGMRVAKRLFSDIPHVAVFDSAYFSQLPAAEKNYPLNKEVADKYKIKRYGAHGTSHEFVGNSMREILGESDNPNYKMVVLHLGNGASASAQLGNKPIATSMGLTPLQGLMMGTRTGDIDPAAVFHLARNAKMSIEDIDTLFNKQSGVKGICGYSDMRDLDTLCKKGDENGLLAFDMYINRLVFYVGAYIALLGGIDSIIFTAGIGENDSAIRKALCDRLAYFGVKIDASVNDNHFSEPTKISTDDSKVKLYVFQTNEELAIARKALEILGL